MTEHHDRERPETEGRDSGAKVGIVEALVEALVNDFRSGAFVPGQRLSEPDLIKRYEVGRGTIREALRRLAGEGLVTVNRFRGASIRTLSRGEMLDTLTLLEVLNGLSARLAAERIDRADNRSRFEAALSALLATEASDDFSAALEARDTFFNTMNDISDNRELIRVLPKLTLLIARIQLPEIMDETRRYNDYRLMAGAILDGDPELAEFAARRHLRHAISAFQASSMLEGGT